MPSYASLEMMVIRSADVGGALGKTSKSSILKMLSIATERLMVAEGDELAEVIGQTLRWQIILAAKLDVSLTTCLELALMRETHS